MWEPFWSNFKAVLKKKRALPARSTWGMGKAFAQPFCGICVLLSSY